MAIFAILVGLAGFLEQEGLPKAASTCQCDVSPTERTSAACLAERDMASHVRRIAPGPFPGIGNEDMNLRSSAAVEVAFANSGIVTTVRFLTGQPMMADSVLRSVRTWSFRPVQRGGRTLGGCGRLTVDYELTRTKMSTAVR